VYLSLLFCSYFVLLCFFMFCSCFVVIQGGSNMTGTNCDLFTHKQSRSYLNHLVVVLCIFIFVCTSVGLLPPGESPIAVSK
jgi:hypothetical protein